MEERNRSHDKEEKQNRILDALGFAVLIPGDLISRLSPPRSHPAEKLMQASERAHPSAEKSPEHNREYDSGKPP